MAIGDIQDISFSSPGVATREEYTDVGASAFHLGTYKRLFNETDFEIWTAASGGTQLTLGTDYEFVQKSDWYSKQSAKAGLGDVYTTLKILNATYQTGSIFMTYDWPGTIVETQIITDILADIAAVGLTTTEVKTADYTILDGDSVGRIYFEQSTADLTATLPTLADNRDRILEIYNSTGVIDATCDTTSGSTTATMDNTSIISAGMNVYGNNVNAGTTVASITNATTFELSANANKTETNCILEFCNTVTVDGEGAETIDGLTTIELPRDGDRIKIQGTSDEWKILDGCITCQLVLDTDAGWGSGINIPYFTNIRENCGNFVTLTNDSTDGCVFTINKSGMYNIDFLVSASGSGKYIGLSLNSDQLSTSIRDINAVNKLTSVYATASALGSVNSNRYFKKGDEIRPHAESNVYAPSYTQVLSISHVRN
jgi:hypothetical protein